jgi:hypothetical protein
LRDIFHSILQVRSRNYFFVLGLFFGGLAVVAIPFFVGEICERMSDNWFEEFSLEEYMNFLRKGRHIV